MYVICSGILNICLFFLFAVLDFIGATSFFSKETAGLNYLMRSLHILTYAFLSVLILHQKLNSHKYLSIAVIVIGVIIVNVNIDLSTIEWYWILLSIFRNSLYAIKYTGGKMVNVE